MKTTLIYKKNPVSFRNFVFPVILVLLAAVFSGFTNPVNQTATDSNRSRDMKLALLDKLEKGEPVASEEIKASFSADKNQDETCPSDLKCLVSIPDLPELPELPEFPCNIDMYVYPDFSFDCRNIMTKQDIERIKENVKKEMKRVQSEINCLKESDEFVKAMDEVRRGKDEILRELEKMREEIKRSFQKSGYNENG